MGSGQTIVRQVGGQVQQVVHQQQKVGQVPQANSKINQKPIKDPNAPKKPLSAYFLFSQDERLKVKAENPDYSITEVAKELGRRWAIIDPGVKQQYEQRYQSARKVYDQEMSAYKPQKKKKDPNAPKQPLSAYFIFSSEERLKVKAENPSYSICEVAKELGRRWADMAPEVKQRYQQMAEEGRQKYDQDMAAYRQGNFQNQQTLDQTSGAATVVTQAGATTSAAPATTTVVVTSQNVAAATAAATSAQAGTAYIAGGDYSSLLQ